MYEDVKSPCSPCHGIYCKKVEMKSTMTVLENGGRKSTLLGSACTVEFGGGETRRHYGERTSEDVNISD